MSKKNICFMLPSVDLKPTGGYKIVYEYANRLVAIGWNVTLAYGYCGTGDLYPRYFFQKPLSALSLLMGYVWQRLKRMEGGAWFPLDGRIRKKYPLQFSPYFARLFPRGTRFVATYITTVENLNAFNLPASDKINFIQDFEAWDYSPEEVFATYRYPMVKIVISNWLADKVSKVGARAIIVPNGLDFNYFRMSRSIKERKATEVAMLWHIGSRKRTKDAVAALHLVKVRHPDLHVTAFGTRMPTEPIPDWIDFVHCPNKEQHNRIYNNAAIFVAPSEHEGWGLTPCEAMQCGAAVACTDIGGYQMFAQDGKTALMSPACNPEALAENICRLIENDDLRFRIAEAGHENIQQFTWERSFVLMQSVLDDKHGNEH